MRQQLKEANEEQTWLKKELESVSSILISRNTQISDLTSKLNETNLKLSESIVAHQDLQQEINKKQSTFLSKEKKLE